ncbi:hypothetical protein ON010_g7759 [Phytophthora cinnamomi]|nr:hypothetical protein ON010_g7759 [Phytophthora cinnamomi]
MSSLFGEEVAEYGGDSSSSSVEEAAAAFDKGLGAAENVVPPMETSEHLSVRPARVVVRPKKSSERKVETVVSGESSVDGSDLRGGEPVDVLLLQGPCSFVRGVWTGGDVEREELQRQIHELADELKIAIKSRNYDSEKIILQMLLEARPEQVIVLTWNVSLTKSPFIVHALELIRSRVIVVSPIGVDHGPLPANVVGVLSGFWNQSLSLAINAAANLIASDETKKISAGVPASQLKKQQSSSAKGKKKKVFTCNLCGEEGHIRRNCPKLPKSKK